MKGRSDPGHLLQVERLILPRATPLLVQDFRHFAVAVMIEQSIDLSDDFRFGFTDLRDRNRPVEGERSRRATAQTHMSDDLFTLD